MKKSLFENNALTYREENGLLVPDVELPKQKEIGSRINSTEMKELLCYMSRHHEDLEKTFNEEQKEIFEKFHDCWSEYMSLAEAAIFEYSFCLGARLAIDVQKDT